MNFRHHPDGWIYIGEACYPLDWFMQQEPSYNLPASAIAREYIPNERHSLYSKSDQWGGELPWVEGDRYLVRAGEYQAAWEAANQPNPTPTPENQPNWTQFRSQVSTHAAYLRLVTGSPQNSVFNSLLISILWQVGNQPELLWEASHLWNVMSMNVSLTESEIEQLNAIAFGCNIPLRLNALGAMEVT